MNLPADNTNPLSRRRFIGATVATTAGLFSAPYVRASDKTAPPLHGIVVGHGAHRYRVDMLWSKTDPEKTPVKNCHEMVQTRDGRLFMITDEPKNNILIYSKDGTLLGLWTLNLGVGHGLTLVTEGGKEVFWIADPKGRVVKASLDGELLMELPTAVQCGAYKESEVYRPTEVAVGPDGQIYVADGYGSQYILRFDSTGKYLGKFGGKYELAQGWFVQAHGIALDTRGETPLLVCTERMRNEFQWFTLAGEYVKCVYLPGAFVSRPVIHGDFLYSGVCFGMEPYDYRPKLKRGFITILDKENRVVSNPGGHAPHYNDAGKLEVMLQDQPILLQCHDVCVDDQGDLYACQWSAKSVYPYKLHRVS